MFERGVAVVGLGYIGLPTSVVLASHGVRVTGVDVDRTAVESVNAGTAHIVEPDLDAALAGAVARGTLTARSDMPVADAFLIAVPTPFTTDKRPDLTYVEQAIRAVAEVLTGSEVVILESTCPPGTTALVSSWIAEVRPDLRLPHEHPDSPDVHVAHCPERVLPGRILTELVENDRLVGGVTQLCAERAAALYRRFVRGKVIVTDAGSAEMAKLAENAFRDVNIAFANELANVCDHLGLDVWNVIELANQHPRVNVLQPGPGVGGHCIAVDPWFIVSAAPDQAPLIQQARSVNDGRPQRVVDEIGSRTPEAGVVVCLGLSYKAGVGDLRESPAVRCVELLALQRPDLEVLVVEPHIDRLPDGLEKAGAIELAELDDALLRGDTVVLLVNHTEFLRIDPRSLGDRVVLDTRGVWDLDGQR